jgi:multidrug transporter EmrE-like cation transporter
VFGVTSIKQRYSIAEMHYRFQLETEPRYTEQRMLGVILAVGCMGVSRLLLWLAQKEIALGTAYAVWTGIGAAGTFLVGVWFFGDATSLGRYLALHWSSQGSWC